MATGDVHRLNDIEVEEVSLVDRAANKRKFLLVKREEGTMTEQLVADGRGGFTRVVKKDEKDGGAEDEATAKAKAPPFPPKKPDAPGAKKPDDKDEEDDDKKKPFPGAKKPFGKAEDEKDDEKDDDKKKPWEKAKKADAAGLAAVSDLRDLCEEMLDALDSMAGDEEVEASDKKKKAEKVVEKMLAAREVTGVAKAGRKMSAARLDKLKSALSTLDALIKEVDGALTEETKTKAAKAAKEAAVDDELKKNVATLVEQTAKLIAENETLRKSNTDLTTEVSTLKKSVPAPNSSNPEQRTPAKKADADVVWPMNMNPKRSSRITKGGAKSDKDDDDSFL